MKAGAQTRTGCHILRLPDDPRVRDSPGLTSTPLAWPPKVLKSLWVPELGDRLEQGFYAARTD